MDFDLTDEQRQLQDSVARYIREEYSFEAWRKMVARPEGADPAHWQRMADLGWLALAVPEDLGGLGGTPFDTMVVMGQFGRGLVLEPFVSTCVLSPVLLAAASSQLRSVLLPEIIEGKARVALAAIEADGRFNLAHVATTAMPDGTGGYVLSGAKSHVFDGATADLYILPARTAGAVDDTDGITLFAVPANAAGLSRRSYRGPDHSRSCSLVLNDVAIDGAGVIGSIGQGHALLEKAVDHGLVARLAEAVGIMDALLEITVEYLRTREQFGVKIGTFQALQHRAVDMSIACEEARSLCYHATASLAEGTAARRRAVSAAKARIGQNATFVGHQAVQLHGGIGTTEELIVSHYLKRINMFETWFGNADHHRARFAGQAA